MRRAERVRAWRQRRLATHGNGTLLVDAGANAFGPGLVYNADSTVASRALFRALGYDAFAVSAPDFEAGAGAGQPGGGEDRPVPGDEYVAAHVAALAPAQAVVSNLDRASSVHLGSSRIRPYSLHAVGGGHSVALLSCMHEHTPLAPATTASVAYTLQLCRAGLISATESILSETERVGKQRPVFAVIINGMESAGNTTQLFVEQIAHELLSIDMVLINSDTAPWLGAGSATTITNYAGKPVLLASLGSNALGHRLYDVAVRFAAPGSGGAPVLSGYAITKDELDCTVAVSDAAGAQTRPHIDVLRAGLQDWLAERVGNVVDTAALQSAEDCAEQGSTCATGIVVADAAAAAATAAVAAADGNGNTGTVVSLVPSKLVLNSLLPSSSQSGDDPSVERVAAAATTTTMTTPTMATATNAVGFGGCPCYAGAQALLDAQKDPATGTLQFHGAEYPGDWGVGKCAAWDAGLQPYCADAAGKPKADAPPWCRDAWCWVDPSNCDLPIVSTSSYFPDSGLAFSYQTCGEKSTFTTWAEEEGVGAGLHPTTDVATLIENYLYTVRSDAIASYVDQVQSPSTVCEPPGCTCPSCKTHAGKWMGYATDFGATMFRDGTRRGPQFHPHGGQYDFVWLSARTCTPHGGASYVR